jgi:hypothetical protein
VSQWHQAVEDCSPNVALEAYSEDSINRLRLVVRGGDLDLSSCEPSSVAVYELGVLLPDMLNFELRTSWASAPSEGSLRLRINGKLVVNAAAVSTLYTGQGAYMKLGIYTSDRDRSYRLEVGQAVRIRPERCS